MEDMSIKTMADLYDYMRELTRSNAHVKFFPRMDSGYLVSISVRFFVPNPRKNYTPEKQEKIFEKIERLSHGRLVPEDNGLFKRGILELKANYLHKYCNRDLFLNTINYISEDMLADIVCDTIEE